MTQEKEDDIIYLDFFKGRNDLPISRNKDGKICLLNLRNCKKTHVYVNAGEHWKCHIDVEEEKKLIVTPLWRIFDAKENEYLIAEKAKLLKEKMNSRQ